LKYEFRPKGEFIFRHGDKGTVFYIILEGNVQVHELLNDGKERANKDPIILGSGQSFGEISLIYGWSRSASIETLTDCQFAVLEKEDYLKAT